MNNCRDHINSALVAYLGYGISTYPSEQPSRIIDMFGGEAASIYISEVKDILNELKRLRPDWSSNSLVSAGVWAKEKMRLTHPELDSNALNALEWAFTWWWK
jgi:hypothetical protein